MATFKQDPTRTTTLRQRFMGEAGRRFRKLKGLIREVVVEEDGFGLTGPTVNRRFDFPRDATKVEAFMEWLRQAQRDEILEVRQGVPMERAGQQAWTSTYIRSAYKKGMSSAAQQMRGQGVEVSDRWLDAAFNRPIHADRVGLIYTRAYSQLEGITEAMDQQISRELAQGLAEGKNPLEIARRLNNRVDKVGRTRARTLARTEVISAHADATLNSYQEAGVEGVEVEAEWSTAGDSRVCELCRPMEGQVFELEEARGMIPRHPNSFSEDTEVLTLGGWKLVKDLKIGDKCKSMDPDDVGNDEWEFVEVVRTFSHIEEKMVHIKSDHMDQLVTPKHDVVVYKYHDYQENKGKHLKFKWAKSASLDDIFLSWQSYWGGERFVGENPTSIALVDYNKPTYCVELAKWHVLVCRRNGTMFISGNCRCTYIPVVKDPQGAALT